MFAVAPRNFSLVSKCGSEKNQMNSTFRTVYSVRLQETLQRLFHQAGLFGRSTRFSSNSHPFSVTVLKSNTSKYSLKFLPTHCLTLELFTLIQFSCRV